MTEFKVTDYGAVPDGVTDSTAAFESALADAEKCHGTVLVPSGDYIVGKLRMGGGRAARCLRMELPRQRYGDSSSA